MTSSRIAIEPKRRAAIRFLGRVHRKLQKAYANKPDLTQADIARTLGVNRSVVNRRLRGMEDMTLGTVAELAWAMGAIPTFDLIEGPDGGQNIAHSHSSEPQIATNVVVAVASSQRLHMKLPQGFVPISPAMVTALPPITIQPISGALPSVRENGVVVE